MPLPEGTTLEDVSAIFWALVLDPKHGVQDAETYLATLDLSSQEENRARSQSTNLSEESFRAATSLIAGSSLGQVGGTGYNLAGRWSAKDPNSSKLITQALHSSIASGTGSTVAAGVSGLAGVSRLNPLGGGGTGSTTGHDEQDVETDIPLGTTQQQVQQALYQIEQGLGRPLSPEDLKNLTSYVQSQIALGSRPGDIADAVLTQAGIKTAPEEGLGAFTGQFGGGSEDTPEGAVGIGMVNGVPVWVDASGKPVLDIDGFPKVAPSPDEYDPYKSPSVIAAGISAGSAANRLAYDKENDARLFEEGKREFDVKFKREAFESDRDFAVAREEYAQNYLENQRQFNVTESRLTRSLESEDAYRKESLGIEKSRLDMERQSQMAAQQQENTRLMQEILSNPSDILASLYTYRGETSPYPQVSHADLLNQLPIPGQGGVGQGAQSFSSRLIPGYAGGTVGKKSTGKSSVGPNELDAWVNTNVPSRLQQGSAPATTPAVDNWGRPLPPGVTPRSNPITSGIGRLAQGAQSLFPSVGYESRYGVDPNVVQDMGFPGGAVGAVDDAGRSMDDLYRMLARADNELSGGSGPAGSIMPGSVTELLAKLRAENPGLDMNETARMFTRQMQEAWNNAYPRQAISPESSQRFADMARVRGSVPGSYNSANDITPLEQHLDELMRGPRGTYVFDNIKQVDDSLQTIVQERNAVIDRMHELQKQQDEVTEPVGSDLWNDIEDELSGLEEELATVDGYQAQLMQRRMDFIPDNAVSPQGGLDIRNDPSRLRRGADPLDELLGPEATSRVASGPGSGLGAGQLTVDKFADEASKYVSDVGGPMSTSIADNLAFINNTYNGGLYAFFNDLNYQESEQAVHQLLSKFAPTTQQYAKGTAGPVRSRLSIVGEKGPELLVNHGNGSFDIVPNDMLGKKSRLMVEGGPRWRPDPTKGGIGSWRNVAQYASGTLDTKAALGAGAKNYSPVDPYNNQQVPFDAPYQQGSLPGGGGYYRDVGGTSGTYGDLTPEGMASYLTGIAGQSRDQAYATAGYSPYDGSGGGENPRFTQSDLISRLMSALPPATRQLLDGSGISQYKPVANLTPQRISRLTPAEQAATNSVLAVKHNTTLQEQLSGLMTLYGNVVNRPRARLIQ